MKQLHFGDCLDILKNLSTKHPDGFIDLIYIDPPFNSKRDYNVLFESMDMTNTKAQREAFADTWSNVSFTDAIDELEYLNLDLHGFLQALRKVVSDSTIAYISTMAIRIHYMHKVLKDTGSFYLHCDPEMSHYLKIICDIIFGKKNFKNEIIWKRTSSHNLIKRYGPIHDVILFYSKSNDFLFNILKLEYTENQSKRFSFSDEFGNYKRADITGSGTRNGYSGMEWNGYDPTAKGRHWGIPRSLKLAFDIPNDLNSIETLNLLDKKGVILHAENKNNLPGYKNYIHLSRGHSLQDLFVDINPTKGKESLGYPTQKPLALMERIIEASTNKGDVVADFFCGCGTTIAAANKLGRNWIGADISHLAIKLILNRLTDPLTEKAKKKFLSTIEIDGFPKDIDSAKQLAKSDQLLDKQSHHGAFDFQHWVVEFLLGGIRNPKEIADGGWDGYIIFPKNNNEKGRVLIEVKSGNVNVKNVREFIQVINKQDADIGVFACFEDQLTKPMEKAAKEVGKYKPYNFDKIQILTIEDIFDEREIKMPAGVESSIFKQSTKDIRPREDDPELF